MQPTVKEQKSVSGSFRFVAEGQASHGHYRTWGGSAQEARDNWFRDVQAHGLSTHGLSRPTRRQSVVSRPLADDDERYPALRGPIEGIIVNEPFLARGGWHKLQSDGVVSSTPIIVSDSTVGRLGDGANNLRAEGNRLYLTIVLDGRQQGVADAVRAVEGGYVNFSADWRGQPDRYEFDGGHRVGILEEWGLTAIILGRPEYGRGSCRLVFPKAMQGANGR